MRHARTVAMLATAVALATVLTGCEKPNPGATVFSGTTSQSRQAACWNDTSPVNALACAQNVLDRGVAPTVPVVPGQTVGISVDPKVADLGWSPQINGQNLAGTTVTDTYFRFTFPEFQALPAEGLVLQVVAGDAGSEQGIWLFRLVPAA